MARAMSIAGLVVSGLLALVFAADLILQVPFSGASPIMDLGFLVCSLVLAYLSWNALRDAK